MSIGFNEDGFIDGDVSSEYVYEDDSDRFYPDDDVRMDDFQDVLDADPDEPDVDYMQEQNDFAHDDECWIGDDPDWPMEDQHLDGMYEE